MRLLHLILEFIHQLTKLGGLIWLLEHFKGISCFLKYSNGFINKTTFHKLFSKE